MNKLLLFLIVLALIVGVNSGFCRGDHGDSQGESAGDPDAYTFPVKPGTREWKKLKTSAEKFSACQVPGKILDKMSTQGLVDTCLDYPMLGHMWAFQSLEQGFLNMVSKFNGLQELLKRKDAGNKLLLKYLEMDPEQIHKYVKGKRTKKLPLLKNAFAEVLLSREEVISNLSSSERFKLLSRGYRNYNMKKNFPDTYGYMGLVPCLAVMKKVMEAEKILPPEAETLKRDIFRPYGGVTESNTDLILSKANEYIEKKK